jgi:hypothetical protein
MDVPSVCLVSQTIDAIEKNYPICFEGVSYFGPRQRLPGLKLIARSHKILWPFMARMSHLMCFKAAGKKTHQDPQQ